MFLKSSTSSQKRMFSSQCLSSEAIPRHQGGRYPDTRLQWVTQGLTYLEIKNSLKNLHPVELWRISFRVYLCDPSFLGETGGPVEWICAS